MELRITNYEKWSRAEFAEPAENFFDDWNRNSTSEDKFEIRSTKSETMTKMKI